MDVVDHGVSLKILPSAVPVESSDDEREASGSPLEYADDILPSGANPGTHAMPDVRRSCRRE